MDVHWGPCLPCSAWRRPQCCNPMEKTRGETPGKGKMRKHRSQEMKNWNAKTPQSFPLWNCFALPLTDAFISSSSLNFKSHGWWKSWNKMGLKMQFGLWSASCRRKIEHQLICLQWKRFHFHFFFLALDLRITHIFSGANTSYPVCVSSPDLF